MVESGVKKAMQWELHSDEKHSGVWQGDAQFQKWQWWMASFKDDVGKVRYGAYVQKQAVVFSRAVVMFTPGCITSTWFFRRL